MLNSFLPDIDVLDEAIGRAQAQLAAEQQADGHFVYELEADATIPAEYILLEHFLDRIDDALEAKIGVYLREIQGSHGGWPLFHGGKMDLSASVKAYFALKAIGDDPDAAHMRRARQAILAAGGAERTNVFTRIQLALYGQVPWRACPVMPVEIMLLPRWFPITMWKVSYWSRTVMAPLLVLMTKRPLARNPRGVHIRELFVTPPEEVRDYISGPYKSRWGYFFKAVDNVLQKHERRFPKSSRARAVKAAIDFITPRLNGEDGLGGIYPAMANTVMMFDTLGYPPDHPDFAVAWQAVRKLLVIEPDRAYCQPCFSPVWDTALAGLALAESRGVDNPHVADACEWLKAHQILDVHGDWMERRPQAMPGGWAFQYNNPHYPDVDDTAVAGLLLGRSLDPSHAGAIERARHWVLAMQSSNGGWGAFDTDNEFYYLNHIPFADHGALLDPPTADVTARCICFLSHLGVEENSVAIGRGVAYLRDQQEEDGSWFGRWGTNYIYGTWSVLTALNAAQVPKDDPVVRRGVDFLLRTQRDDGGWGEDCETYAGTPSGEHYESLPSQTSWALLGLMAADEVGHPAVARGIAYLQSAQEDDGLWREASYNAVGFPRVFYLKYHGYPRFFPLMAMARFRNLIRGNSRNLVHAF